MSGYLFAAAASVAAMGATAAAQQPAQTAQQMFDAAAALEARGDWAGALAAFERLEAAARNKRTRAIARLRRGNALYQLARPDDAVASLRAALLDLPTTDPTLAGDRYQAHLILGQVAEDGLDYAGAAADFAAAEALAPTPALALPPLAGLAAVGVHVDPAAAAAALDRADRIAAGLKLAPADQAAFARRRALLALNRGDFAAARTNGERAVKLLGGLTARVDLADVSARGDAALAMLLGGAPEDARRYMAYTGAGRIPGGFGPGAEMKPPPCGGEAALKPTDVAVVEFSIAADGQVASAEPVYAAGGSGTALEFARAVRGWSWKPEQVAAMPAFFRNNARVEMRCSTAFERPSVSKFLEGDLAAWLAERGAPLPDEASAARQRAALVAAEAGGADRLAVVPHLYRLAVNAVVPREEGNVLARRALAVAAANGAPATARLAIDLVVQRTTGAETWGGRRHVRRLERVAADPVYAADARARAAALLLLADALPTGQGRAQLDAVAGDPRLAANDPLKVGALIRLASLEQQAGRPELARAAFEKSGLSADQCALVDREPKLLSSGFSSGDFPAEALRWGFEGWVSTELDIAADGRVPNARAVLAYPPFVFSPTSEKNFRTARFEKTFRPDGGPGCGGLMSRVRFLMPK